MPPERRQLLIELETALAVRAQAGPIGWLVLEAIAAHASTGRRVVEVRCSSRSLAGIVGVSKDSVKSHDGFKAKHGLPFHLIADTDGALHEGYGTWGTKKNYGREYQGTFRSSFLVGADGRIAQAWPKVRVKGHVDEVLAALEALQG